MSDAGPDLQSLFEMQHRASRSELSPLDVRLDRLKRLERLLLAGRQELIQAVSEDFGGRSAEETLAFEITPMLGEIRHAMSNLASWMEHRPAALGWKWWPARAEVRYQPLGVVGVLGAWNYPIFLTIGPIVGALAAGNRVLVKPSELAPQTAETLRTLVAEEFRPEELRLVTGGVELAARFTALPFDHILFTGSERVARLVLRAAAENLTPVTLELGGKCPALIHESYDLRRAATRILTGKLANAGQTCVAPDYVLLPGSRRDEFLRLASEIIPTLYPKLVDNPDYTRILNPFHYRRLQTLVSEARSLGADVLQINPAGEDCTPENHVFPPTLVSNAGEITRLMHEEIFGPVLPLVCYENLDEALDYINSSARPLALYYFDNSRRRIRHVLDRTLSGGVTVNDCLFHLGQPALPFGGVGASGNGQYHGYYGFENFSKKRAVLRQSRYPVTTLLRPPFTSLKKKLIGLLAR